MMKRFYSFVIALSICVIFLPLSATGEADFSDKKSQEHVEHNVIGIIPPNTVRGTTTIFSEDFEGAWPGSWTVVDSDTNSDEDYWGDNSYRAYAGSWSGWCADIGSKSGTETATAYTQNFDNSGAIPSGWTTSSEGPDNYPWEMVLDSGTDYHAECSSDAAGSGTDITEWLYMTSGVDCSAYSSLTIEFYLDYNYYDGDEFAQVLYAKSSDYPTFTILKEWNSADVTGTQSIDLSAAAGDSGVHIGFRYHGTWDYWMKVDDVVLTGTKTVDIPNTDTHTYDNDMYASMYRSVTLSSYDSATLTFYLWLDSESGYDYFKVRYYTTSWIDLYSKDGNTGGWIYVSVTVPTTATYVGFLFDSDTIVYSYEGAYVDDVVLTGSTTNTPPPTPTLNSPSNGATGISTTPTLICNSVTDADGDSVSYYFIVDDDADWSSPATEGYAGGAGDTNYVVGTDGDANSLLAGPKYYWCVCVYDGTDFGGWSSVWSFTTASVNSPPTASFTYSPSNPTISDIISFTDTSTDSDGTIASWSWDFGDGGTSTLQNPTHQYSTATTYTVTLTVTDDDGATDGTSQNIVVTETPNSPPTASFTYSPVSPTTDDTVSFTDTSTDSDGTITAWSWDFGDGTTSILQNPTHQYTMGAVYTVTLTATDNDGATDSTSQSINVGWGTIGPSGLVYVLVDSSIYSSIQSSLATYKSDLENEGYSVGIYSDSWATISDVRTFLQNAPSGLVGAVLVGNLPIPWYRLKNPDSWGANFYETFPTELYYMDLDGTWSPGSGTQANPFTDHTGNVAPEIWVGRLYASTSGAGDEVTLINNYFNKNHNYRIGNLQLPNRALVYVDDDWYSYADQWDSDVGLLYNTRTLVKDKETTIADDYKNRLALEYEWISLFSHSDSWYHAMKYNSGASWSYVYNTDITTIDPRASFYNLYCCYAANYSDGADNGYLGGRYVFSNTYGLMAVGSTKTGSMLNFDDFYSPLGNGKTIGNAFKDWYSLNGETGQGADSRAWFYGMTVLGDPTLKPNSTTTDSTPPTGSISINSGETYTTTTSVTLTLNAVDAESGVSQMCFSDDGTTYTSWEAYATSKSWTLPKGDGTKTVYVKYKDNAGLVSSAYSDTIILDTVTPTSSVSALPKFETTTSFTVSWSGSDATSGIGSYDVQYKDGSAGTWTDWLTSTTLTSSTFTGTEGHTYYFQCRATDNAGNVEAYPGGDGDTSTTIDATAPSSSVSALPKFETTTSFAVSWSGTDSASGIANYDVQYKDGSTGTWTNWQTGVTTTSATFTGTDGHTYYFQCRATDNAGNVEAYLGGDGDTSTTIDATAPSIISTAPSDGGVNVSLTQNIIIQFSEEMDTGSVIYTCSPNPGGWISSWNATKDMLTLAHNNLSPGVTYMFNVTAAKDLAGHDLVSGSVSNPWIFATAKITEFNFSPGWSFLTLPFINSTINNAESLANAIGEKCTAIAYWNNSLGRFITHPVGTEISNFNIEAGVGYMVFVTDKTVFTFTGESKIDSVTMTLDVGWNSVGRFNETTTTAESIGDSISNCTHVARWNETSQSFDVHAVGSGVNNFNIEQDGGYLVYVTKESEWVNE